MSSILRGNDNLDSYNLATDTELSIALEGKANTIVANDSQIKTALNATGTAPIYACRAWVNFNGTGTVSIRASGNVSSITDNGTGNYTVNFTIPMSDMNYSAVNGGSPYFGVTIPIGDGQGANAVPFNYTNSSVQIGISRVDGVNISACDSSHIPLSIFR